MSTVVAELYDALIAAGAPEEKARAAAGSVIPNDIVRRGEIAEAKSDLSRETDGLGTRLSGVENKLSGVETRMGSVEARVTGMEAELRIIKWLMSGIGFGTLILIVRSFMA